MEKDSIDLIYDEYSKKILDNSKRFKTVSKISIDCNIPISTTYRRINLLKKLGFLETVGFIAKGVRINKYKCIKFTKYNKYNPRIKILKIITENPGLCYKKLQERSGMSKGTLSHHVTDLIKDSKIVVKRTSRRLWFFSSGINSLEADLIIHLRKETSKNILTFLLINGSSAFTDILKNVKKSPPTVSLTLTHLVESGLILRISGRKPIYELKHRDLTFDAIKNIEPSKADKMKDRFADTFSYF